MSEISESFKSINLDESNDISSSLGGRRLLIVRVVRLGRIDIAIVAIVDEDIVTTIVAVEIAITIGAIDAGAYNIIERISAISYRISRFS
jgi:hypothetical protein